LRVDTAAAVCRVVSMSNGDQTIKTYFDLWQRGTVEKFEFYHRTRGYAAQRVADITGIDIDVIRDRRRYLRQLAKQGAK
jgi:hypothetical protein